MNKQVIHINNIKRSSALRLLSNLWIQEISPLLVKALQTAAQDSSIYVRKAVPIGLLKVAKLDPELLGNPQNDY